MPSDLQKRRVVYVSDRLWNKVSVLSNEKKISSSSALRLLLENEKE